MAALTYVLQPYHIGVIFFGTLIGILVGAMPGLSSIMGLSIMMPLTLSLEGNAGILMLLGIFCGAIYGGSITAILIKTPGHSQLRRHGSGRLSHGHPSGPAGTGHRYFHHGFLPSVACSVR